MRIVGTVNDGSDRLLMFFPTRDVVVGDGGAIGSGTGNFNQSNSQMCSFFSSKYTDLANRSDTDTMTIRITGITLTTSLYGATILVDDDNNRTFLSTFNSLVEGDLKYLLDTSQSVGGGLQIQRFQTA